MDKKARIAAAEKALFALLAEVVAIDLRRRSVASVKALTGTPFDFSKPVPTREESLLSALAARPIDAALRQAIRFVGEFLFAELKSTDAMVKVAERVCARSRDHSGWQLSVVDHAWDGIGEGTDVWLV